MRTQTVGEILRRERQARRIELAELAKLSRIKEQYLQYLEDNDFASLPAAAFARIYIKSYGQILGFDHKPLLALLRRDFDETKSGQLIPRAKWESSNKRQGWQTKTTMALALLAVIGTLLGYVLVQYLQFRQPPKLTITAPTDGEQVAAQVVVSGQTTPQAMVSINEQPVAIHDDGSFSSQLYLPREGLHLLTIEAVDQRGKVNKQQLTVRVVY